MFGGRNPGGSATLSAGDLAKLQSIVDKASQIPPFVAPGPPFAQSIREAVDVAILKHQGKPFNDLEITSNDVPSGVVMDRAIHDEFRGTAPAVTSSR